MEYEFCLYICWFVSPHIACGRTVMEMWPMLNVGHESFNSQVNSFIVSCEFGLTHPNRCELWVWFNSVFVWVVSSLLSKINSLRVGSLWLKLQIHNKSTNLWLTGRLHQTFNCPRLNWLFPIIVNCWYRSVFTSRRSRSVTNNAAQISGSLTYTTQHPKKIPALTIHHKISNAVMG